MFYGPQSHQRCELFKKFSTTNWTWNPCFSTNSLLGTLRELFLSEIFLMDISLETRLDIFSHIFSEASPFNAKSLMSLVIAIVFFTDFSFLWNQVFSHKEAWIKFTCKEARFVFSIFLRSHNKGEQLFILIVHNRSTRDINPSRASEVAE